MQRLSFTLIFSLPSRRCFYNLKIFPVAQSQVAKGCVKGNDSKIVTGFLPKGHNSTSKLKFWVSYIDFALRLRTECAQKENIIQLDICNVLYYISYW